MRLIENALWQIVDQVVGRGLLFVFYVAVPLVIGLDEYGRFAFLHALILIVVQPALLLGLELLVVTGVASGDSEVFAAALLVRGLTFTTTGAIVALLGLMSAPEDRPVLWLLWLHQGTQGLLAIIFAYFRGRESMRMEAVVGVLQKVIALPVLGILALAGVSGALLPAATLAVMGASGAALLAGRYRRAVVPLLRSVHRPRLGDPGLRALLRDGARLGLARFAGAAYFRLGSVMLGLLGSREAVGAYAVAFRIMEATQVVPVVVMNVGVPRLARATNRGPALRVTLLLTTLGLVVSAGLYLTAERLVGMLYGGTFAPAGSLLGILALAVTPIYAGYALTQTLIVTHRADAYLRIALANVVLNVALNAVLIPLRAATGAAVATVVTESAVVALAARTLWSAPRQACARIRPVSSERG